ncbi:MAG: xanthine dehydrogenase family protein molybdopterin-binding subunit [Gemmatimonadetes bacterium]|nr:xanthine dehydrogenase family protein molybdopterin-binding subunit [Gemmatimonadota bacterium]MYK52271.1 xanthine dehydrogenase family protein molybdopterin-binding subunit [Gemmatimonadota bacterium]
MAYQLIGKDFTPPDVAAKVTGKAKYAEDFRAEGMVFCRLLLSTMPHARVRNINVSEATKMQGVLGILTADDVPEQNAPNNPILTNNPHYVGDPILAVAALDEQTAQDAIDKIAIDYEPLPFTLDPLESLYPGGTDAREDGNIRNRRSGSETIKWTAGDFVDKDVCPTGKPATEWSYGEVDQGFENANLIIDESFVTANNPHHSMEPRSCMALWENGKCFVYGATQSQSRPTRDLARLLDMNSENLVYIAEYCGGGFGSKGTAYPVMAIPPLMSKKVGRPVMMRISRAEEYFIGSARHGFQGRIKIGFRSDGRISALDMYVIQENGAYRGGGDWTAAGDAVSLVYTPEAMRFRGIPVYTNTPIRGAQRGPGQNQIACVVEPLLDKAAEELGIDQLAIRRINAPDNDSKYGRRQGPVTSVYMREALDKGGKAFDWAEKKQKSRQRNGSKVIGVGVGQAYHSAGSSKFDGLVRLTPEGKLHIHSGVGNLGTFSHTATSLAAAEVLTCKWENCVIERGDSRRHLPWNHAQWGSNTSFTMTRTNYVAAMDAKNKLLEIAAKDLGGSPGDYDLADERVVHKTDKSKSMGFADAAKRAIELGGKYDGHEAPEDIHAMTKASVAGLAGTGLIGVAKDNLKHEGVVPAMAVGLIEIELDLETGKYEILDYVGVAECGTVLHPQGLETQIKGGAVMGFGLAALERYVYDPQNGLPANMGLYQCKPPSYLDVPSEMKTEVVDIADPQNPVGAKGIGEPVQGCAAAALLCAISDALGGHYFNRMPVTTDHIVNAAAGREQSYKALQVNTV